MTLASRARAFVVRPSGAMRPWMPAVASAGVAAFCWCLRYNDPEGEFAGLTDDHFFYAIRGWQMLFGDRPDRDYVDPGAPLTLVISALLQVLHRSVWSEYVFGITILAIAAGLTCAIAIRASGSIVLGVCAALLEIALFPRLYNYPKLIAYAAAIPVIWWWIDKPVARRIWLAALVAAVAFLLRHDHGVYIGATFVLAALARGAAGWQERVFRVGIFAIAFVVLLTPYLAYLELNGGIGRHFDTAYRWSQRDRDRAPLVLPTLTWRPLIDETRPSEPLWWRRFSGDALNGYSEWWFFWLLALLPLVTLTLVAFRPSTGPPDWPHDRLKIAVVAALALMLNDGFLRGNLAVRFADVSVPAAILAAWSVATIAAIARTGRLQAGPRLVLLPVAVRGVLVVSMAAVILVTALIPLPTMREQIERSSLLEGPRRIVGDALDVTARLRQTWPLAAWAANDPRGPMQLALYLDACTSPTDRVLVTPYLPVSVGLSRRAFAAGHGDLRPGFFSTRDDQELALSRLARQSVPIVIAPRQAELADFTENFPLIADHLTREYDNRGDHDVGRGLVVSVLISKQARPVSTYERLSLPCFR